MIFRSRILSLLFSVATIATGVFFEGVERSDPGLDLPAPVYRLEPEPMDPAELPPRPAEPIEVLPKPADPEPVDNRPLLTLCVELGCQPCQWRERDVDDGLLSMFRVEIKRREKDETPDWIKFYPAFLFTDANGRLYSLPRQDGDPAKPPPVPSIEQVIETWQKHNPGVMLAAPPASMLDQLAKFLGPEGTIVVQPSRPVTALLEDGSKLSYARLAGKYRIDKGVPSIIFDPPLARVDARKLFLHVGAQIQDARYEPPATIAVGTTAGRYRLKLEKADP